MIRDNLARTTKNIFISFSPTVSVAYLIHFQFAQLTRLTTLVYVTYASGFSDFENRISTAFVVVLMVIFVVYGTVSANLRNN